MRGCLAWTALLVAATALCVPSLIHAAACTPSELEAFEAANATVAPRCVAVVRDFGTCADDCLAGFTAVVRAAPACSAVTGATSANATTVTAGTLAQSASAVVAKCEAARAAFNASGAYAPTLAAPGAPACTASQEAAWEAQYGPEYLFGACSVEALTNRKCTGECLDKIEEGVKNAPRCRQGDGELLFSEAVKFHLVRCLTARRERLDTNAVLQAAATAASAAGSGSTYKSPEAGVTTASTKPQTSAPAATTVAATAAPVAKPVSSATRASAATSLACLAVVVVSLV